MSTIKLLVFSVIYLSLASVGRAETYGLILSGGSNLDSNHYRYYSNTKKMYDGLRSRGVKRHKILTLYADGGGKGVDTLKKGFIWDSHIDTPKSLEGDAVNDIRYGANRKDMSQAFDVLARNMKDGDDLVLFVTDHGSKYGGVVLWHGEYYNTRDFKSQLDKLPKGVTTHIITNICYGGQLQELTSPNTCVMSTTDASTLNYSYSNSNPFADGFSDALQSEEYLNSDGLISLYDAFLYGKKEDGLNDGHMTSLNYFLEKQKSFIELQRQDDNDLLICHQSIAESPLRKLVSEIDLAIQHINFQGNPKRLELKNGLEKRIKALKEELESWRISWAEFNIQRLRKKHTELEKKYSSLSQKQKHRLRPRFTRLAEELQEEISHQEALVKKVKKEYENALRELRFLKYASGDKFKEYLSIKRCLEYEI